MRRSLQTEQLSEACRCRVSVATVSCGWLMDKRSISEGLSRMSQQRMSAPAGTDTDMQWEVSVDSGCLNCYCFARSSRRSPANSEAVSFERYPKDVGMTGCEMRSAGL